MVFLKGVLLQRFKLAGAVLGFLLAGFAGCLGSNSDAEESTDDSGVNATEEDIRNTLEGWIQDGELLPLAGAAIDIPSLGANRVSNADGQYRFVNLPVGEHLVTVTMAGYDTASQRALLREGFSTVLNFSLEKAPDAVPHDEILPFIGQVSCDLFLGSDPETATRQACGDVDPNNAPSHEFEFGPGGAQVQLETFWDPTTKLASNLTIKVETVGFGHQDVVFAHQAGSPGMKVIIGQANMEKYYANGGRVRVTLGGGPSITGDEAEADVGFAFQQRFEIDFTVFYVQPGPLDYTSRP